MNDILYAPTEQLYPEGWAVFQCDGSVDGPLQICKVDELDVFAADAEAIAFVMARASQGYHHASEALRETAGVDNLVTDMSASVPM